MTLEEAKLLAQQYLESLGTEPFAFYDHLSERRSYGWVLFYNSRQFIETGNILYAFGGNGPLVVLDASGEVASLPTYQSYDDSIRGFERERGLESSS
jgi:hypothetical protein